MHVYIASYRPVFLCYYLPVKSNTRLPSAFQNRSSWIWTNKMRCNKYIKTIRLLRFFNVTLQGRKSASGVECCIQRNLNGGAGTLKWDKRNGVLNNPSTKARWPLRRVCGWRVGWGVVNAGISVGGSGPSVLGNYLWCLLLLECACGVNRFTAFMCLRISIRRIWR